MAPPPYIGNRTTKIPDSGSLDIDALLLAQKWGRKVGTGATVKYSFPDQHSSWADWYLGDTSIGEPFQDGYRTLYPGEKVQFRKAISAIEEVANLRFVEVADQGNGAGEIRVAVSGVVNGDIVGWAYGPRAQAFGGDIWLSPEFYDRSNPKGKDSLAYFTFMHELGHAVGLEHPFQGAVRLTEEDDTHQNTIMSYTSHPSATVYASTPMVYDIAALQYIYGTNTTTRSGNTEYTFKPSEEHFMTIWDAGGRDVVNLSNQRFGTVLDLRGGKRMSSIGKRTDGSRASGNIGIAYGANIENARGSRFGDHLYGNNLRNTLIGNAGGDHLRGFARNDRLVGGDGGDLLEGGTGADILDGGKGADTYEYRSTNQGGDLIKNFNQGERDRFVFDKKAFGALKVGNLANNRFLVNTTGEATDAQQRFVFNTTNNTLYYDADGNGAQVRVAIATLENDVTLRANDIFIGIT